MAYLALVLPTVAFYPALVSDEQAALERTIAAEYAPEVLNHRDELRVRLSRSREQLDAVPVVADAVCRRRRTTRRAPRRQPRVTSSGRRPNWADSA